MLAQPSPILLRTRRCSPQSPRYDAGPLPHELRFQLPLLLKFDVPLSKRSPRFNLCFFPVPRFLCRRPSLLLIAWLQGPLPFNLTGGHRQPGLLVYLPPRYPGSQLSPISFSFLELASFFGTHVLESIDGVFAVVVIDALFFLGLLTPHSISLAHCLFSALPTSQATVTWFSAPHFSCSFLAASPPPTCLSPELAIPFETRLLGRALCPEDDVADFASISIASHSHTSVGPPIRALEVWLSVFDHRYLDTIPLFFPPFSGQGIFLNSLFPYRPIFSPVLLMRWLDGFFFPF